MSKSKLKKYTDAKRVIGNDGKEHVIFVYGELTVDDNLTGIAVHEVTYNRKSYTVETIEGLPRIYKTGKAYGATKNLNFGWSICHPNDEFNVNKAIELCKKRFSKSGISTQDCRFLTDDMVKSILQNEIRYIETVKLPEYVEKHNEVVKKDVEYEPNVKKYYEGEDVTYVVYSNGVAKILIDDYHNEHSTRVWMSTYVYENDLALQKLLPCETSLWKEVKDSVKKAFNIDVVFEGNEAKLLRNGVEIKGNINLLNKREDIY